MLFCAKSTAFKAIYYFEDLKRAKMLPTFMSRIVYQTQETLQATRNSKTFRYRNDILCFRAMFTSILSDLFWFSTKKNVH